MATSKRQQDSEDRVEARVNEILNAEGKPVPPPPASQEVNMVELNITNKMLVHGATSLMRINLTVIERIFLDPYNDALHPATLQTALRCLMLIQSSCALMIDLIRAVAKQDKNS